MPVFKDFAENGELLDLRNEELNPNNFDRYLKENGTEIAKGYLDALTDFAKKIENCLQKEQKENNGKITLLPRSDSDIRRQLLKLQNQTVEVSDFMKQRICVPK